MTGVVLAGTGSGVGKTVARDDGIADEQYGPAEHRTLGTYARVHAESGAFDTFLDNHSP